MSRVQDFFGVAPKTVLNKPFMHVQDQKNSGTNGGASIVGYNYRDLNTIIANNISGASLSSNQVILPAGTYYFEGESIGVQEDGVRCNIQVDGVNVVEGIGQAPLTAAAGGATHKCSGEATFTETVVIDLVSDIKIANAVGLGNATGRGGYEIYSDLKIWQLDADVKAPVIVSDKLYPLPGNTIVTGNMYGLDYEYTSANSITVQPGICMDSTNTVVLSASSSQVVTIPSAINEVYNLFLCNDGVVRTDTDVSGASLSAYSSIRWIGFVLTNVSGAIVEFIMSGDKFTFEQENPIGSSYGSSFTTYSVVAYVPTTRCKSIGLSVDASTSTRHQLSIDGVNSLIAVYSTGTTPVPFPELSVQDSYSFKCASGTGIPNIYMVTLKR